MTTQPAYIELCVWHEDGLHEQCTAEDLRTWAVKYQDPFLGGAICPACRKLQTSESCSQQHLGRPS